MPPRPHRRAAHGAPLAAAVLALVVSACAGTVDGSGGTTTTRRPVATTRPGVATTGAPLPTTAAVGTTVAVAPSTTAAPTAATSATAALPPPGTLIGPPLAPVTLVESPLATRNAPTSRVDGVLAAFANPAYDRAVVVALAPETLAGVTPGPGWTVQPVDRDPQWQPDAFRQAPHAAVGARWAVVVDAPARATDPTVQLVAIDLTNATMTGFLETPNRVRWFPAVRALDERTVGILFDPTPTGDPSVDPAVAATHDRLVLRRLDLAAGRATDQELRLPNGYTYRSASFDGTGAVLVATTSDEVLRARPGAAFELIDPAAVPVATAVDGALLDWTGVDLADPAQDVPVRDGNGTPIAMIFPWRLAGEGPDLGLHGWSANRGWFSARRDDPATGTPGRASPGVYDVATATWDWAFAAESPVYAGGRDPAYVVAGLVARTLG